MILVDTSVWIDYLRERDNPAVAKLTRVLDDSLPFGISPIIFQELLQGAKTPADFNKLELYFGSQRCYHPQELLSAHREAAHIYLRCRLAGTTVRSTVDCLIAQTAIEHNLLLLHNDRDFTQMAKVISELRIFDLG
ncbi:MAG: twitching motility protein PilT [Halothiobacillaceae bacterium]|nr:MAG: twitching motility protein PilT [Halothiobacillaceae bacterium]